MSTERIGGPAPQQPNRPQVGGPRAPGQHRKVEKIKEVEEISEIDDETKRRKFHRAMDEAEEGKEEEPLKEPTPFESDFHLSKPKKSKKDEIKEAEEQALPSPTYSPPQPPHIAKKEKGLEGEDELPQSNQFWGEVEELSAPPLPGKKFQEIEPHPQLPQGKKKEKEKETPLELFRKEKKVKTERTEQGPLLSKKQKGSQRAEGERKNIPEEPEMRGRFQKEGESLPENIPSQEKSPSKKETQQAKNDEETPLRNRDEQGAKKRVDRDQMPHPVDESQKKETPAARARKSEEIDYAPKQYAERGDSIPERYKGSLEDEPFEAEESSKEMKGGQKEEEEQTNVSLPPPATPFESRAPEVEAAMEEEKEEEYKTSLASSARREPLPQEDQEAEYTLTKEERREEEKRIASWREREKEKRDKKWVDLDIQTMPTLPPDAAAFAHPATVQATPYLSPQSFALFYQMVGTIFILTRTRGISRTEILLDSPAFATSKFYGSTIIIEKYATAPDSLNIRLTGNDEAVTAFNQNLPGLMTAFKNGNFSFRIGRLEVGYKTSKKKSDE